MTLVLQDHAYLSAAVALAIPFMASFTALGVAWINGRTRIEVALIESGATTSRLKLGAEAGKERGGGGVLAYVAAADGVVEGEGAGDAAVGGGVRAGRGDG